MESISAEYVKLIVVAVIVTIAAITDIRSRKIPNLLTFPAMLAGFIFNAATAGWHGVLLSLGGWALAVFGLLLLVLLNAMRMGDVKLLAAVGSFGGWHFLLEAFILTAVAGGIMGLIYALQRKVLGHTVRNAMLGAHVVSATRSTESLGGMVADSQAGYMPYGPAIACGTMLACLGVQFHKHLF